MAGKDDAAKQPIIIKRIKKGGGHHGGAWKVAYADFVTAMMAFFLLLWLLNVTTEDQKNAIANYFDPTNPKISEAVSGSGGLLGGTSMSTEGAMVSEYQPYVSQPPSSSVRADTQQTKDSSSSEESTPDEGGAGEGAETAQEDESFAEAEKQIKQAIESTPELAPLLENLIVDITPEGLRIQIVDQNGRSMFPSGSAQMYDITKKLLEKVAQVVVAMPNEISVRGHTDSVPYGKDAAYTNWELSSDRANASRRVLLDGGLPQKRLNNIVGKADTEPLIAEDPRDARNRRISIILLRDRVVKQLKKINAPPAAASGSGGKGSGSFTKTPGNVYFP